MSELAAVGLALASLRTAYDMTKGLIGVRDAVISQGQIFELQRQILTAQEGALNASIAQTSLLKEIGALRKQVSDMETWETEKERYELRQVSSMATLAYVLKVDAEPAEPVHCICATCYQNRKKSILQGLPELQMRKRLYECSVCKSRIVIDAEKIGQASTYALAPD